MTTPEMAGTETVEVDVVAVVNVGAVVL